MTPLPRFHPNVLAADPARRAVVLDILQAALAAVEPAAAVRRAMARSDRRLLVGEVAYDLAAYRRVLLVAFGKAALPMAQAAAEVLGDHLTAGLALTRRGHAAADPAAQWSLPPTVAVLEGGHPVPDEGGVAAARRIADLAAGAGPDDLVVCLISGGGSALLTLPADGLTLADLQATTQTLLRSGAPIQDLNAVRKHLEQLKGGQLARLAAPATVVSLVLSDVVGNPLDVIASGPTVPDPTTWADAWTVVERYGLQDALPAAVVRRLQAGLAGALPDTPKAGDLAFQRCRTLIVADNAAAAEAACRTAQRQGMNAAVLSTFVEGEAREVARVAVALGREVAARGRPLAPPACLVLGGETTVTVRGHGRGGRNQELALAAAMGLAAIPEGDRLVVASLATDGSDGPTDAAGALVDGTTLSRGRALGLDAAAHLAANNAYPFLAAVGDLLVTGPTQTNVNDLIAVCVF
ncbi:MAG: DUF4147 domain-containing protein [Caldilineales bacterium]|nr:DUF4147 domain-containing protein [Caldilineales bacterium]MDW8317222.1 DUF4147 domain-containing protein [Anaerolineae bacterium]